MPGAVRARHEVPGVLRICAMLGSGVGKLTRRRSSLVTPLPQKRLQQYPVTFQVSLFSVRIGSAGNRLAPA